MIHFRRLVPAAAILLAGVVSSASAQTAPASQESFKPTVGQSGKDVVWVPTSPQLVEKMLDMAKVTPQDYVMDLGSGDGRNIIAAAKRGATATGVEFNPDMVELSRKQAAAAGVADRATFIQGDMYEADISKASVLALFLLPHNLNKLVPKFLALKPGSRIVGNTFAPEGWVDVQVTARLVLLTARGAFIDVVAHESLRSGRFAYVAGAAGLIRMAAGGDFADARGAGQTRRTGVAVAAGLVQTAAEGAATILADVAGVARVARAAGLTRAAAEDTAITLTDVAGGARAARAADLGCAAAVDAATTLTDRVGATPGAGLAARLTLGAASRGTGAGRGAGRAVLAEVTRGSRQATDVARGAAVHAERDHRART